MCNRFYYLEFLATVHLVEKDLWLLTVEEVARLRFLSTMVKLGKFFTPIQVDVPEVFDLVPT